MMKRPRHNDERGQSMVLIALVMVGLIAFLALVIDGGMTFAARRQMQNAADAAALAGVRKLFALYYGPHTAADEQAIYEAVIQYAQQNGVDDPADVEAWFINDSQVHTGANPLPGNGSIPADAVGVEVTTATSFPSFFATVVGQNELGASALAASILFEEPGGGPYAVWADSYDPTCGLDMTGSFVEVIGSVHSNSDAHLTGSDVNVNGAVEYCGDCTGCSTATDYLNPWATDWCDAAAPLPSPWQTLNVDINRFSDPDPAIGDLRAAAENDDDSACVNKTIRGVLQTSCYHSFTGLFKPEPTDDLLPDGLYYVDGNVHIKGTDLPPGEVHITIVATGTIRMEQMGANHIIAYSDLDGYGPKDLLLFSNQDTGCAPWVIDISSSGTEWEGIIFAPCGEISISSSDMTTVSGAVWGYTVNLSGSTQVVTWSPDFCGNVISPSVFLIR